MQSFNNSIASLYCSIPLPLCLDYGNTMQSICASIMATPYKVFVEALINLNSSRSSIRSSITDGWIKNYIWSKHNRSIITTICANLYVINTTKQMKCLTTVFLFSAAAARIHNPIPVEKFSDHVNKMRQSDNKKFQLEFEVSYFYWEAIHSASCRPNKLRRQ